MPSLPSLYTQTQILCLHLDGSHNPIILSALMVDCPSPRLFRQPRLFGQALVSDLPNLHLSPSILQYVNYLHLCSSYYLPPTYYYSPQLLSRERIPSLKKDSTVRLPGHLHGSHHNSSTPCHHPTWKGTYCLPFSLKTRPLLGTCRVRPHLDPQFQCPCSCLTSDTKRSTDRTFKSHH